MAAMNISTMNASSTSLIAFMPDIPPAMPPPVSLPSLSGVQLVALFIIAFSALFGYSKSTDPLSDIPGPFWARWTPLWLAYQARLGIRFKAVDEAHKRYGHFVRISPWHVSISDPAALHLVYGHGEQALLKSNYYDAFVAGSPSVFSSIDRIEHRDKRRLASHAFSIRSLQSLAPFVHTQVEQFTQKMDDMCGGDDYIDTMKWFNYLAFDVISDLAFGEPIGMVEKASDHITVKLKDGTIYTEDAIHLVDHREHAAAVLGCIPNMTFRRLSRFLPDPFLIKGRQSNIGIALLARSCVDKRLATAAKRDDILNKLIEARVKEHGVLDEAQITQLTAEAVTILIAGSHTASSSTAAILHLLKSNPPVFDKLRAELDEHIGIGQVPSWEQVKDLPYLQAVITEGLRHHGTNAIGLPRIVPEGGFSCLGKHFPEGSQVSIPSWTLQHDEKIWGDPHSFRPERWLEDPDLRRFMLTFGMGPRTCLGKHLVNMEMQLVLSMFILRYDVELKSNVLDTIERFQHEPRHMFVKVKRRAQA